MRKTTRSSKSVGVIVARFQVPSLTEGHRALIDYVLARHQEVLVVLGESRTLATPHDPLPYELRAAMVAGEYPTVRVHSIRDNRSDALWSEDLDRLIAREYPGRQAVLYGSRKSFFPRYHGENKKELVPTFGRANGTEERAKCGKGEINHDFRRGVIHSACSRPPRLYQTVDVAVLDRGQVLLAGRKEDNGKLRFIGGFVDPSDTSLEHAAGRECAEETDSIGVHPMHYVGSTIVDDWRYAGSCDRIMTALFVTTFMFGGPRPSDDIDSLVWVPLEKIETLLVPEHLPLAAMLKQHLDPKKEKFETIES